MPKNIIKPRTTTGLLVPPQKIKDGIIYLTEDILREYNLNKGNDFYSYLEEIFGIDKEDRKEGDKVFEEKIERIVGDSNLPTLEAILSPKKEQVQSCEYLDDNELICREDPDDWLGSYESISSPGKIKLRVKKLQVFFFRIVRKLIIEKGHKMDAEEFKRIAELSIYKTYYHELFHHFSDVYGTNRQGLLKKQFPLNRRDQSHYKFKTEEALAVAASRHLVGLWMDGSTLDEHWAGFAYQYRSIGYEDWILYQSYDLFMQGIYDYFQMNPKLTYSGKGWDKPLKNMLEYQFLSLLNNPYASLEWV